MTPEPTACIQHKLPDEGRRVERRDEFLKSSHSSARHRGSSGHGAWEVPPRTGRHHARDPSRIGYTPPQSPQCRAPVMTTCSSSRQCRRLAPRLRQTARSKLESQPSSPSQAADRSTDTQGNKARKERYFIEGPSHGCRWILNLRDFRKKRLHLASQCHTRTILSYFVRPVLSPLSGRSIAPYLGPH